MLDIYAVHQPRKMNSDIFQQLLAGLPEKKQARLRRYIRWQDAQRGAIAEALIRMAIIEKLGLPNRAVTFHTNAYGKPYLTGQDHFHFNLSHSGDWVVAACGSHEVGIDVEIIKKEHLNIARRFFSPSEYDYLVRLPESKQAAGFFDLWTLKESYIKAVGQGLYLSLDTFSIVFAHDGSIRLKDDSSSRFHFKQYAVDPEYKLSVCFTAEIVDDTLTVMSLEKLEQAVSNMFTSALL